jgi:hypothetical protein
LLPNHIPAMKCPRLLTAAAAILLCSAASAQLGLKFPALKTSTNTLSQSSSFRSDIQKVVDEYPHHYAGIRGEVIDKNPQTVEYASRVKPDGVQDASITQYSAIGKDVYTWQSTVVVTESFEDAARKYKWLYQQLKGMNIKYVADLYTLRGAYAEPDETIGFATSVLTPDHPPTPMAKLKMEVQLSFEFPEWKVSLLIYDREREDDEQGNVTEGR